MFSFGSQSTELATVFEGMLHFDSVRRASPTQRPRQIMPWHGMHMPRCHCLVQPAKGTLAKPVRNMCVTVENDEPGMSSASKGKDHAQRRGEHLQTTTPPRAHAHARGSAARHLARERGHAAPGGGRNGSVHAPRHDQLVPAGRGFLQLMTFPARSSATRGAPDW
jgi:hypothetical protein